MALRSQGPNDNVVVDAVDGASEEPFVLSLDEVAAAIAERIDRDDYVDGERFRLTIGGREIGVTPGARVEPCCRAVPPPPPCR